MKKYIILMVAMFIGVNAYAADTADTSQAKAPTQGAAAPAAATVAKPAATAPTTAAPAAVMPAPAATAAQPAAAAPQKKLTKAEMIARINEILKNRPNIVPSIQGLEAVKQENGAVSYLYNKKKLEDLDEDTLLKLLSIINQQVSIENIQQFDRQQRQLKNLQQIQQLNKTQQMLKQNTTTTAPKVYTPPKIPKTYK